MRPDSLLFRVASVAALASATLVAGLVVACGGARSSSPASAGKQDGARSLAVADGGSSDASADAAASRPFAGSAMEATQLIGAAVDKRSPEVRKCVAEYRTRKNLPRERVQMSMGIDQEGRLLGVTLPKGKQDAALSECVQQALAGASFPRSHTGVISVTKSYEEIEQ